MLNLKVEDLDITIYSDREIKESNIDLEQQTNLLELNLGYYAYIPSGYGIPLSDNLLKLAGYDPRKVDPAVPQDWWNEEYKKYGVGPNACWTYIDMYGKELKFGQPLYWKDIRNFASRKIFHALTDWFEETVSNMDRKGNNA